MYIWVQFPLKIELTLLLLELQELTARLMRSVDLFYFYRGVHKELNPPKQIELLITLKHAAKIHKCASCCSQQNSRSNLPDEQTDNSQK
jgi:hypothetical protein